QRSAADFPLSGMTQAELDRLGLDLREVADLYPATPLQAGLLFHGEEGADQPSYVNQLRALLPAGTEPAPLREAWRMVVARHGAPRTGLVGRDGAPALQCVRHAVDLPVIVLDWREVETGYEERLVAWRKADLASGFDTSRPPLLRVALIRRPDERLDMI